MSETTQGVVGSVVSLRRYPVKSMMGEELNAVDVTDRGLLGDRAYALLDPSTGKVASAKNPRKWAKLFDCRATFVEPPLVGKPLSPVRIMLPDGTMVTSEQSDLNQILTQVFSREVTLGRAAPKTPSLEEYWPDMEGLAHREKVTDETMPPETFFDLAVIHVLTTATIDRLRELYPQGRFEVRRFRPNIVVEPSSGAGAVLAKFGLWGWGAASSIQTLQVLMVFGIVFGIMIGIAGIEFLVQGSKYNPDEPSSEEIEPRVYPGAYCFHCTWSGNGEIYNSAGEILWRFRTGPEHFRTTYGLFRLPDFVVYDAAERELFRIRRERRLPSRFVMLEDGRRVCTISQRSIFLNKYALNFADGSRWAFHMPLFTVVFGGVSGRGALVRVRLETHNVWYVSVDPGHDSLHLVSSLAFIHRERLRCV